MTELTDGIRLTSKNKSRKILPWILSGFAIIILCSLSWGAHHIGVVNNTLGVELRVEGHQSVSGSGHYVIGIGEPILYKITIENRGRRSIPIVEIQASLHSNGGECAGVDIMPGSPLEGDSISPLHTASLPPGQSYSFETMYIAPNNMCPGQAHLKTRVTSSRRGLHSGTTLVSPVQFEFE